MVTFSLPFDGGGQDVPDSSVQNLQHTSQQQSFCGLTCHLWEGKELGRDGEKPVTTRGSSLHNSETVSIIFCTVDSRAEWTLVFSRAASNLGMTQQN